jgi:hypothetical protein
MAKCQTKALPFVAGLATLETMLKAASEGQI